MAKLESKLAKEFHQQLGNVNKGIARTVSICLAAFEQFVRENIMTKTLIIWLKS